MVPDWVIALITLTALEIVLGVDNIVFISILVGRLPPQRRERVRLVGLPLALGIRIGLLFSISWVMGLTDPLFVAGGHPITGRDIILLAGGMFLIAKATHEIHQKLEGPGVDLAPDRTASGRDAKARAILLQILLLDIVFSLDSVITAVGMANEIWVMVTAMVIAVIVMLFTARGIGEFVETHPTVKVLALSFLLMIGVMLTAEGTGVHVPKGYLYFAMAFSLAVEMLNLTISRKSRARP